MAAITYAAPARSGRKPLLPLAAWFTVLRDWRRARMAEAELRKLPDHILDDLGLSRGEIVNAVRNGRH